MNFEPIVIKDSFRDDCTVDVCDGEVDVNFSNESGEGFLMSYTSEQVEQLIKALIYAQGVIDGE